LVNLILGARSACQPTTGSLDAVPSPCNRLVEYPAREKRKTLASASLCSSLKPRYLREMGFAPNNSAERLNAECRA
jgi:hypothetical protein